LFYPVIDTWCLMVREHKGLLLGSPSVYQRMFCEKSWNKKNNNCWNTAKKFQICLEISPEVLSGIWQYGCNQRVPQPAFLFCFRQLTFTFICCRIVSVFVGRGSSRYEQLFPGFLYGRKMGRHWVGEYYKRSEFSIHNENHSSVIGPDSASQETKRIGYRIMTWKLVVFLGFMDYCCLYRQRAEGGCSDVCLMETRNEPTATPEPASEHDTEPLPCTPNYEYIVMQSYSFLLIS